MVWSAETMDWVWFLSLILAIAVHSNGVATNQNPKEFSLSYNEALQKAVQGSLDDTEHVQIIDTFRREAAAAEAAGHLSHALDVKVNLAVSLMQAANKAIDRQK